MTARDALRIVIAAGGTGGHLFPAQALAQELSRRGWQIFLMTDERANRYGVDFACEEIIEIPSATISPRAPLAAIAGVTKIVAGLLAARRHLRRLRPDAVIGFGGYPTLPPVLAASLAGIATCVHEQNAVVGRVNRLLARRVDRIASTFPDPKLLPPAAGPRVVVTGNPVRDRATAASGTPYPGGGDAFRLLVFGGSQGARVFADVVPAALAGLDARLRARFTVVQQAREEDLDRVRQAYAQAGIAAELATFFDDLPERMAASTLVIARSGASTLSELGVLGRPALLVPLPHALDGDQLHNARAFADAGGGWVMPQAEFTPETLRARLETLAEDAHTLTAAADAAKRFGRPDAAGLLADLVQGLAGRNAAPEGSGRALETST